MHPALISCIKTQDNINKICATLGELQVLFNSRSRQQPFSFLNLSHRWNHNHMHAFLHVISMQISSLAHKYPVIFHFTPHSNESRRKHTKMANKLFLVCATLALFFLLTNASIYRTVVEFDEDDATNPMGPKQKCRREFQQSQHLRACQQWIRKQMKQGGGGPMTLEDDDEFDFEDDIENPQGPQQMPPLLQQCCNELHQEEPVCVCPTLKQAAKAVRLQGQHGPFQTRHIYRTAKRLPNVCKIPQVGVCPFKAIPFFPPYY